MPECSEGRGQGNAEKGSPGNAVEVTIALCKPSAETCWFLLEKRQGTDVRMIQGGSSSAIRINDECDTDEAYIHDMLTNLDSL